MKIKKLNNLTIKINKIINNNLENYIKINQIRFWIIIILFFKKINYKRNKFN